MVLDQQQGAAGNCNGLENGCGHREYRARASKLQDKHQENTRSTVQEGLHGSFSIAGYQYFDISLQIDQGDAWKLCCIDSILDFSIRLHAIEQQQHVMPLVVADDLRIEPGTENGFIVILQINRRH